jgi:hypothetical protein
MFVQPRVARVVSLEVVMRAARPATCALALAITAGGALAADYIVRIRGKVELNTLNSGPLVGVPANTPCEMFLRVSEAAVVIDPAKEARHQIVYEESYLKVGAVTLWYADKAGQDEFLRVDNNNPNWDGLRFNPDALGFTNATYSSLFQVHDFSMAAMDAPSLEQLLGTRTDEDFDHREWTIVQTPRGALLAIEEVTVARVCNDMDFNNDEVFPDNQDLFDFVFVLGGGACPSNNCDAIDFNNDGVFPDTQDLFDYLRVFSAGPCLQ